MFSFLIKKAFFDMWDNMIAVFLMNLGFVLVAAAALYVPYLLSFNTALAVVGAAIGILLFNVYCAAASIVAREMVSYRSISVKELWGYVKETWKAGIVFGIITAAEVLVVVVALPFYLQLGGLWGMAAVSVIFWVSVLWGLASQFFFPIRAQLDTSVRKILRKCFIVFFDNTLFSIGLAIGTILVFAISAFTAFLLPGVATILIWHQSALKLRLLKYDYLEKNPEANRRAIPWDALLVEERERVGHRTFRGMIFPWKE